MIVIEFLAGKRRKKLKSEGRKERKIVDEQNLHFKDKFPRLKTVNEFGLKN